MTTIQANGISINYRLEGEKTSNGDLIVLVNGLADDLETWEFQIPDLLAAGHRVLRYDNRGIGKTDRPAGPYTAEMLADDLHALLDALEIKDPFHLVGVSMGGMISQAYALKYPNGSSASTIKSVSLCCTYAEPTTFCSRMFALWAEMAERMSVQDVMRDVSLWAFTVAFFRTRGEELAGVEEAMSKLDMPLEAYLAQLNVIQKFDTTGALTALADKPLANLESNGKVMVLAGEEDILIPVQLSKELAGLIKGSHFTTSRGGHGCMWEFPAEFNKTLLAFIAQNK